MGHCAIVIRGIGRAVCRGIIHRNDLFTFLREDHRESNIGAAAADQPARLAGQVHVVLLGDGEGLEQLHGVFAKLPGVGDLQLALGDAEAALHLAHLAAARAAHPLLALLDHQRRVGLDRPGVPVVVRHEALDGKLGAVAAVAEGQRDLLLDVERELVVLAAAEQVQLVAQSPEEVEGGLQLLHARLRLRQLQPEQLGLVRQLLLLGARARGLVLELLARHLVLRPRHLRVRHLCS